MKLFSKLRLGQAAQQRATTLLLDAVEDQRQFENAHPVSFTADQREQAALARWVRRLQVSRLPVPKDALDRVREALRVSAENLRDADKDGVADVGPAPEDAQP